MDPKLSNSIQLYLVMMRWLASVWRKPCYERLSSYCTNYLSKQWWLPSPANFLYVFTNSLPLKKVKMVTYMSLPLTYEGDIILPNRWPINWTFQNGTLSDTCHWYSEPATPRSCHNSSPECSIHWKFFREFIYHKAQS